MKIALLGYGLEGKSTEKYFKSHFDDVKIDIFDGETSGQFRQRDYSSYDIFFRSPSVPPLHLNNESSVTKYFFDHCPCPIIGVTATKGKGTICSFIKSLLDAERSDVYLVGNIGVPALEVLDNLTKDSVAIYELSSFQLWDLDKSPHIAVLGHLEPDHLNIHESYSDYLTAKSNIARYQSASDYLVYYSKNPEAIRLANTSKANKISYPLPLPEDVIRTITLSGIHNQENATAAIAAVACFKNISPDEYLKSYRNQILAGLKHFHGLPHRLEYLRTLNGVDYYDDNFSTNPSSTQVAINAFPGDNLVLILGGRDKTNYQDLPEIYNIAQSPEVKKIILLGESGHELAARYRDPRFMVVDNLTDAVTAARREAEQLASGKPDARTIVLMSPAAASFDMFESVYDRGAKFQDLISSLK